ncbi:MAG TPA: mannose-1-phosphate guanylyltransferase [Bacteroidota bacterium]|nr:mannose-1-phosphate guanylyltransferase [Bacteroidota bacterium]
MESTPKIYAVIMAGGVGARFWPRSREKNPKQLLEIAGEGTMIQNTIRRLGEFVEPKNVFVVTNKMQKNAVMQQLPNVPAANILVEPVGRNTAPCIGLAAMFVQRLDPKGVMVVLPADHIIQDEREFVRVLELGARVADESASLVTIGIQPNRPETGYGYIQVRDDVSPSRPSFMEEGVFRVKTFAEKPNPQTAQQFLDSGDFLWNSGMFMWRVDVILSEIQRSLPDLHEQLKVLEPSLGTPMFEQSLERAYGIVRSISIDYGVMEKARSVYVIRGNFGWNDVGSWDEVCRMAPKDERGNYANGKVISVNSNNTYVHAPGKLVATVGVEDLIIIQTDDALLVCRKDASQDVKEVVDYLRRKQMNEYL